MSVSHAEQEPANLHPDTVETFDRLKDVSRTDTASSSVRERVHAPGLITNFNKSGEMPLGRGPVKRPRPEWSGMQDSPAVARPDPIFNLWLLGMLCVAAAGLLTLLLVMLLKF